MNNNQDEDIFHASDDAFSNNDFENQILINNEIRIAVKHLILKKKMQLAITYASIFLFINIILLSGIIDKAKLTETTSQALIAILIAIFIVITIFLSIRLIKLNKYKGDYFIFIDDVRIYFPQFLYKYSFLKEKKDDLEDPYSVYNFPHIKMVKTFSISDITYKIDILFSNKKKISFHRDDLKNDLDIMLDTLKMRLPNEIFLIKKNWIHQFNKNFILNNKKYFLFIFICIGTFTLKTLNDNQKNLSENNIRNNSITSPLSEIEEAKSWGTSSNPAFLSDAMPERFDKTIWTATETLRSTEPIVNNMIDGMAEYYHENGKIYGRIPYLHGQKHGRFNLFFEDGTPDQTLSYKNGLQHGVLTWHKTQESWIYVNGRPVEKIPYEPFAMTP